MVPLGLPHTPSVSMAVMNDVLQGISFVSVYLNDILIIFTARTPHQTCYHSIRQKNVMKSFDALRSALVDAPAIMIPDFNMQFEVITDAYNYALEATLIQQVKPVANETHILNSADHTTNKDVCSCVCTFWCS